MSAALLHDRLATTALFYAVAVGVWGMLLAARGRGPDGNFLGSVVVGQVLVLVQASLGLWLMVATGARPGRTLHLLYGTIGILIWPLVFTYARGENSRRESALFGAGSLFLAGLLLRAISTGGAP